MDDLSLFMLDIVENSFNAHATTVTVTLSDSIHENRLSLEIVDNGIGMDQTTLEKVTNPFYTTRTTRKVGLGIPF
ncbi:MAG: ATP-binding protein, partial [Candidatus Izemoplasmatales bacterium]